MKLEDIEIGKSYVYYTLTRYALYHITSKQGKKIKFEYTNIVNPMNEPLRSQSLKNKSLDIDIGGVSFDTLTTAKKHFAFQLIFRD